MREAGDLAERIVKIARHAHLHNYLTAHNWQTGEHASAIVHGEKGIARAASAEDFSVLYTPAWHLARALMPAANLRVRLSQIDGVRRNTPATCVPSTQQ